MSPEDLELLVIREMPFGKHKGTLIADLPGICRLAELLGWEMPVFKLSP